MIRWPGMQAFDMLVLKKTDKKVVDVDRSDFYRWKIHRIDPLLRHNDHLIGIQWIRADGWWDTVHRLRFGVWRWTIEVAWWSREAWESILK